MPGLQTDGPRYLQNTKEVLVPVEVKFSGTIPPWIKGTILNSSPGIFDMEKGSVNLWMDGYAIISKFEIDGNSVKFSSKYLQSTSYKKAIKAQKPVVPEFGTPPGVDSSRGFFAKLIPAFTPNDVTDNCNGQVVQIGSSIFATGDTPYLQTIDPHTLDTLETYHCYKTFGMNAFTPSPVTDKNGDVFLIGAAIKPTFRYSVMKMPAENRDNKLNNKFEIICTFPSRWKFGCCSLKNTFALTENYIVFAEVPAVINLLKLTSTYIRGYCMMDWCDWRPQDKTRFCIINKHTGKVVNTEIYSESGFVIQDFVNAYEDGNQIILDIFTLPDLSLLNTSALSLCRASEVLENYKAGEYRRYVLPIISDIKSYTEGQSLLSQSISNNLVSAAAKRVGDRIIVLPELIRANDSGFDTGVINPKYKGVKHKYVYARSNLPSTLVPTSFAQQLLKLDVDRRETISWERNAGQFAGEPVFVPNPDPNSTEDDGVLLMLVKNMFSQEEKDFLIAIDSKTMKEIGRAEFNCPVAQGWRNNFLNLRSTF